MRQIIIDEGHFRFPGAPNPLNWFTWNLACLIISSVRPRRQTTMASYEVGKEMDEVVPCFCYGPQCTGCVKSFRPNL